MESEFRNQVTAQVKEASERIKMELITDYRRRQQHLTEGNQNLELKLKQATERNQLYADEICRMQQERAAVGAATSNLNAETNRWKEIAQQCAREAERYEQQATAAHKRLEILSKELFETTQKLQTIETTQRQREALLRQEQATLKRRIIEVKRHEEHWRRVFGSSESVLATLPSSPARSAHSSVVSSRSGSLSHRRTKQRVGKVIQMPGSSLLDGASR